MGRKWVLSMLDTTASRPCEENLHYSAAAVSHHTIWPYRDVTDSVAVGKVLGRWIVADVAAIAGSIHSAPSSLRRLAALL